MVGRPGLRPTENGLSDADFAGFYKTVLNAVLGILIMTFVDFLFALSAAGDFLAIF